MTEEAIEAAAEVTERAHSNEARVALHGWDLFWHWFIRVTACLSVVAVVIAIIAFSRAVNTASCVNANQGARALPANNDRTAQDSYDAAVNTLAQSQAAALDSPGPATITALLAAANTEKVAYKAYQSARAADDAARAANPAGKC